VQSNSVPVDALRPYRNSSIQSKFSIANRWAMKSLIACQNEASRGLRSASRLTALSSSSSAARCAARFVIYWRKKIANS
jgi:hypothetical protein